MLLQFTDDIRSNISIEKIQPEQKDIEKNDQDQCIVGYVKDYKLKGIK